MSKGDIKPLCRFIEQKFLKVFSNRDYKWANELTVKTAFLTLLYNNALYIMDSEHETARSYTDLTMIIRPDMRRFKIFDILIEFKFVNLKQADLTGEEAGELSREGIEAIPEMQTKIKEAENMLPRYGNALEKKYDNLRLKKFAVVSPGFEKLWGKMVK
jgi:hypothetical protein